MADLKKLVTEVAAFYKKEGRSHLPWRKTRDPYKILVSEVMLQQTQVDRVLPYYKRWIKKYPTVKALAKAPLSEVLAMWQGLGYNRRGKYLWEAAKIISKEGWQEKLPGVGPYTKAAVETFAFNKPNIFIETNIRTVFFHYQKSNHKMSDVQLLPLVAEALKKSKMQPREWYWALMDYGSYLKKSGVRNNSRSAHYVKQTKFEGSARQLRGAILRELLKKPATVSMLVKMVSRPQTAVITELMHLQKEGFIKSRNKTYSIAE